MKRRVLRWSYPYSSGAVGSWHPAYVRRNRSRECTVQFHSSVILWNCGMPPSSLGKVPPPLPFSVPPQHKGSNDPNKQMLYFGPPRTARTDHASTKFSTPV
jgi:hypothetical protein